MSATPSAGPSAATIAAVAEHARLLSIYSMMSTTAAGSGHPTSCMSAAELVAGVFFYAMKFDPKNANSNDGDRFVLSKGHAAPLLYSALAEAGVFPVSRVMTLRQFSSELEGHPTPRIHGVDAATGSLGQGLSVGNGLAIGARMDKSPTRVYVLTGDGELAEGQIWEAAAFAAHYNLENLTVITDINALGQSDYTMYKHDMEVYRRKFESEGFATEVIDGHDVAAVLAALDRAKATKGRPQAIIARTVRRTPPGAIDPTVKNHQWGDLIRGLLEASDRGATYPFLTDGDANLTEGSGFNILIVKDSTLYTPQRGVLEGITRKSVIDAALANGLDIRVETVPIEAVYQADEVFMSTTAGGIMPIAVLDDKPIGDGKVGPISRKIWDTYWAMHWDDKFSFAIDYEGN